MQSAAWLEDRSSALGVRSSGNSNQRNPNSEFRTPNADYNFPSRIAMKIDFSITNRVDIQRTPRVQQLEGLFDIPPSKRSEQSWHHHFELPADWNIGVIVGPSGSGKTTLAKRAFPGTPDAIRGWPSDISILDAFPQTLGIKEITSLLCSVGFSSPPAWVRPFAALSTGEQFRVNLARTLAESPDLAVVDEFTSTIDRTAARIGSAAVAKAVRQRNQKFVAVTCHYDVLDWLSPDWIYEPHTGKLERGRLRRRPTIELEIIRVYPPAWNLFKAHHYLNAGLHGSAKCFVALARLDDDAGDAHPAAFVAALPFPHPIRPGWREHRCVCLPDFQGVGIGNAVSEFVAELFSAEGKRYTSTTSHPAMIRHRAASPKWRMMRRPSFGSRHHGATGQSLGSAGRLTAGFEYVGQCRTESN
jgi:hypothetical protein